MSRLARRIVLAARPVGEPKLADFRLEDYSVPALKDGEVLLRTLWLSLDPYMRVLMDEGPSYVPPVSINEVMVATTVARVVESRNASFNEGDTVLSHSGWQDYGISNGEGLKKIDFGVAPASAALGVLGMPGLTAYAGLLEIGKPTAGETVVVAAAAGAVGSAVGQIAKIKGARAIGIAGGKAKCDYVKHELGFDDCIDYRSANLDEQLERACPNGIDVYFENVGGRIFQTVRRQLNPFARIPVCGLIADYNSVQDVDQFSANWSSSLIREMLFKRLTFRGFIVTDFENQYSEFILQMSSWIAEGKVKYHESIADGLEGAPEAFIGLLNGANIGKQLVRVGS